MKSYLSRLKSRSTLHDILQPYVEENVDVYEGIRATLTGTLDTVNTYNSENTYSYVNGTQHLGTLNTTINKEFTVQATIKASQGFVLLRIEDACYIELSGTHLNVYRAIEESSPYILYTSKEYILDNAWHIYVIIQNKGNLYVYSDNELVFNDANWNYPVKLASCNFTIDTLYGNIHQASLYDIAHRINYSTWNNLVSPTKYNQGNYVYNSDKITTKTHTVYSDISEGILAAIWDSPYLLYKVSYAAPHLIIDYFTDNLYKEAIETTAKHCAVCFNGSDLTVFLDGVLTHTVSDTFSMPPQYKVTGNYYALFDAVLHTNNFNVPPKKQYLNENFIDIEKRKYKCPTLDNNYEVYGNYEVTPLTIDFNNPVVTVDRSLIIRNEELDTDYGTITFSDESATTSSTLVLNNSNSLTHTISLLDTEITVLMPDIDLSLLPLGLINGFIAPDKSNFGDSYYTLNDNPLVVHSSFDYTKFNYISSKLGFYLDSNNYLEFESLNNVKSIAFIYSEVAPVPYRTMFYDELNSAFSGGYGGEYSGSTIQQNTNTYFYESQSYIDTPGYVLYSTNDDFIVHMDENQSLRCYYTVLPTQACVIPIEDFEGDSSSTPLVLYNDVQVTVNNDRDKLIVYTQSAKKIFIFNITTIPSPSYTLDKIYDYSTDQKHPIVSLDEDTIVVCNPITREVHKYESYFDDETLIYEFPTTPKILGYAGFENETIENCQYREGKFLITTTDLNNYLYDSDLQTIIFLDSAIRYELLGYGNKLFQLTDANSYKIFNTDNLSIPIYASSFSSNIEYVITGTKTENVFIAVANNSFYMYSGILNVEKSIDVLANYTNPESTEGFITNINISNKIIMVALSTGKMFLLTNYSGNHINNVKNVTLNVLSESNKHPLFIPVVQVYNLHMPVTVNRIGNYVTNFIPKGYIAAAFFFDRNLDSDEAETLVNNLVSWFGLDQFSWSVV